MKKLLFTLCVLLIASNCRTQDDPLNGIIVDLTMDLYVTDSDGNNLVSTPKFDYSTIHITYNHPVPPPAEVAFLIIRRILPF